MTDFDAAHEAREAASNPVAVSDESVASTAKCLASAFDNDPVINWFLRDDRHRSAALHGMMVANVRRAMTKGGAFCASDARCATLWHPPEKAEADRSFWQQLQMLPRLMQLSGVSRLGRLMKLIEVMEKSHPHDQPHHYLHILGVHEDSQGMGLGSSILTATLAKIDAEGVPAYLENSKAKNTLFYERHGFKVTGEIKLTENGPSMWPMWREVGGV